MINRQPFSTKEKFDYMKQEFRCEYGDFELYPDATDLGARMTGDYFYLYNGYYTQLDYYENNVLEDYYEDQTIQLNSMSRITYKPKNSCWKVDPEELKVSEEINNTTPFIFIWPFFVLIFFGIFYIIFLCWISKRGMDGRLGLVGFLFYIFCFFLVGGITSFLFAVQRPKPKTSPAQVEFRDFGRE